MRQFGDAGEDIGGSGMRIDVVEFGGHDECCARYHPVSVVAPLAGLSPATSAGVSRPRCAMARAPLPTQSRHPYSKARKFLDLTELKEGLLIGVGVGIILSIYAEIQKRISRREQIAFIRKRLIDEFALLGKIHFPDPAANEGETPPSIDSFRFIMLERSLRVLQGIADHRTGSMSGTQLSELHGTMSDAKSMHAAFEGMARCPQGLDMYRSLYEGFASLKWLRLPQEPPWEQPSS